MIFRGTWSSYEQLLSLISVLELEVMRWDQTAISRMKQQIHTREGTLISCIKKEELAILPLLNRSSFQFFFHFLFSFLNHIFDIAILSLIRFSLSGFPCHLKIFERAVNTVEKKEVSFVVACLLFDLGWLFLTDFSGDFSLDVKRYHFLLSGSNLVRSKGRDNFPLLSYLFQPFISSM